MTDILQAFSIIVIGVAFIIHVKGERRRYDYLLTRVSVLTDYVARRGD